MDHDELLERALAGYSAVEPPAGFRERVFRRAKRRRRTAIWFAVPVAACIGLWMVMPEKPPRQVTLSGERVALPLPPVAAIPEIPVRAHRVRQARKRVLSDQERALIAWVSRSPETAVAEWTAMKERMDSPIELGTIEIQAIQIEEQSR